MTLRWPLTPNCWTPLLSPHLMIIVSKYHKNPPTHIQDDFQKSFQRTLLYMFKHTITQQEMPRIILLINKGNAFWLCNKKLWTYFLESFGQNYKTKQNHQTRLKWKLKSVLISEYKWFCFGGMSCVLLFVVCFFVFDSFINGSQLAKMKKSIPDMSLP